MAKRTAPPPAGRRRGARLAAAAALLCVAPASRSGEEEAAPRELETLLGDLRELKAQSYREKAGWEREKRELEMLLSQRRARLADVEARRESARTRLAETAASLEAATVELSSFEERTAAWREWLRGAEEALRGELARRPLVDEPETRGRLEALPRGSRMLSDAAARFWNVALTFASLAVEARVETREIPIDDRCREVTVLRLGAAGAAFLTMDEEACGIAGVGPDGALAWKVLPERYLPQVRHAIRVGRRDLPAEIVTVPMPRGGER